MTNIEEYWEDMKNIQIDFLTFLEEDNDEINFLSLSAKLDEIKIHENQHKLMSFLHLISIISNNHHRGPNFISKIERILQKFKDDIKKYYTNAQIFNTFKSNKRILLFLINHQMMIIDEYVAKKIITTEKYIKEKYPQYFQAEIKKFKNEEWFPKNEYKSFSKSTKTKFKDIWIDEINEEELPANFYENRKNGQNDSYICELIRNDSVEEFITYITKNSYSLNSTIQPSNYETNSFLLKQETKPRLNNGDDNLTLIKYAVFFGSIQIFQYLQFNGVKLTPSLWLFAIHGKNPDIIHRLEDSHVEHNIKCYKESIKCHHIDIANYIRNNLLINENDINLIYSLKYYNFAFIQNEDINKFSFIDFCHYGYYEIANNLLMNTDIDVNKQEIVNKNGNQSKIGGTNIFGLNCHRLTQKTALFIAVEKENLEIIQLLLSNDKIDVNIQNIESIEYTNQNGNKTTIIINGINGNREYKRTALYLAVEKENLEIIQLLLSNDKIDVNILNTELSTNTALHMAVLKRNYKIIQALLKCNGIDVNVKDDQKRTPIELTNDKQIISLFQ